MTKVQPALLQGIEEHAAKGGGLSMAELHANFDVGSKILAEALAVLAERGVVEATNPKARRKRYRFIGKPQGKPETRKPGRPVGSMTDKQTLARLRTLRLALDPKGTDPFWRKLEAELREWYRIRSAFKK